MGSLHTLRLPSPPAHDRTRKAQAESSCVEAFAEEIDYLYGALQRLGAPKSDIEDLLQDVFVVLHRNWDTLDLSRPLRPWLFGVAFRVVRAQRRKRSRETLYA